MIQVDLITGFLGSGKTTFIRKYVSYLTQQGIKVGIIENDFGAINVDMVMLADMQSDLCEVEQIVGGNVETDWKRRFKAKLIAMAMQGFKRVVVEPSGIYDVDAFFDVLYDEPVSNWYIPGNIITIVDAGLDKNLSKQARYLLTSQIANAGEIVFSKVSTENERKVQETRKMLEEMLEEFHCNKKLSENVLCKNWDELTGEDYENLSKCGWTSADHEKLWFDKNDAFMSLFFMDVHLSTEQLTQKVRNMMQDEKCGKIFRVKGFLKQENGSFTEINATQEQLAVKTIANAQEVVIVIGQRLQEEVISRYLTDDSQ